MKTDLKSYRSEFVPISCNQGLRLLKNNGQPNLFPKYGNSKQKPSANQDQVAPVVLENKDEFRCECIGCSKICKSRGGLTVHVKKMHSSQNKSTDTCGGIAT